MPLLLGAGGLAALGVLFAVDPERRGVPLCPFKAVTGWDCPGCGMTRGLHDLLHGDVVGALDHNLLLLVAVPLVVVAWLVWVRRAWRDEQEPIRVPVPALLVGAALLVVFGVVRNLPGIPFLGSA